MANLTSYESLVIAHWINVVARALDDAAGADGLTPAQVGRLDGLAQQLAGAAANIASDAVQASFQDADQAFRDIAGAASQASKAATTLAKSYQDADALAGIAGSVLSLAADVMTGNDTGAVTALVGLVGQPASGQGTQVPPNS